MYFKGCFSTSKSLRFRASVSSFYFTENITADLLLLPETFSTGFCINRKDVQEPVEGGIALTWLKKIAQQYNCVVAGTVLISQNDKKVNRFYWIFADGTVEHYDKRHLFRLGKEQDFVEQGQHRKIFTINNIKISRSSVYSTLYACPSIPSYT